MKTSFQTGGRASLTALFALVMMLQGCILVVEEDDDRDRRDRHHGIEWYLEIVFYRTQSLSPDYGDTHLTFVDETRFEGLTKCGPFSGTYRTEADDSVTIESLGSDYDGCEAGETSALFLNQLARATTLNVSGNALKIDTESGNYLAFNSR